MTRDRDIERVLERWFTEGPTQMPDHLFDVVVDRIDRIPQRRLAALQSRFSAMSLNIRIAGVAAIIVLAAGICAFALGGPRAVVVPPSASPIATPTPTVIPVPSSSVGPLAAGLRNYWIGPPRSIPALVPSANFAGVMLTASAMQFDGGSTRPSPDFLSTAFAAGPDHVRFELNAAGAGCSTGNVGNYAFALSPGGGFLRLTADDDACAARSEAVSGDWVRSDCPNTGSACLGNLEAGDHVSSNFNPFVAFDKWTFAYGRFGYNVPGGWANTEEDKSLYVLAKQDRGDDASIWLFSEVVAHSQAVGCPDNEPEAGVGRTPQALASWLTTVRGLKTTKAAAIVIGGLNGLTLDVSVASNWTKVCAGETEPSVALFADANGRGHDFKVHGNVPMRLFLHDLGDGRTLLIGIVGVDRATWDALVPEAMPVVQSFQFNR